MQCELAWRWLYRALTGDQMLVTAGDRSSSVDVHQLRAGHWSGSDTWHVCHALQNLSMWCQNPCWTERHEWGYSSVKAACQSACLIADMWTSKKELDSMHCTMGPQPDLARHQGSRRLVANGVKCMSNYSELSTYHEYGNIFPMSCTVFALQEPRSQNFETITGNKLAAREKCRLIDVKKLQPYIFWNAIRGTHLLIGTPGSTSAVSNVFYFCFRMCHAIFHE